MKKSARTLTPSRVGHSLAPRRLASVTGGGLTVGGGFGQVADELDGGSIGGSTGAVEILGSGSGGVWAGRLA